MKTEFQEMQIAMCNHIKMLKKLNNDAYYQGFFKKKSFSDINI